MPGVAAGLAVLAGIAGSDALCAIRVGEIHRGEDHCGSSALPAGAVPDGNRLAATLSRLIDVKDEALYGLTVLTPKRAKDALAGPSRSSTERAKESNADLTVVGHGVGHGSRSCRTSSAIRE